MNAFRENIIETSSELDREATLELEHVLFEESMKLWPKVTGYPETASTLYITLS